MDHSRPLGVRVERYVLDHSGIFDTMDAMFTPLTLLPGGRWLLSLAVHEDSSYLICWDVQHKTLKEDDATNGPHYSLQPAAHLELRGLKVKRTYGTWAHIQATTEEGGAIIAVRASAGDTGMR